MDCKRLTDCPFRISFTERQNGNCISYAGCNSNFHGARSNTHIRIAKTQGVKVYQELLFSPRVLLFSPFKCVLKFYFPKMPFQHKYILVVQMYNRNIFLLQYRKCVQSSKQKYIFTTKYMIETYFYFDCCT